MLGTYEGRRVCQWHIPTEVPALQNQRFVGDCIELGVGGMTIHSTHVPRMDEVFEVAVLPPEHGGPFMPLHARVRVRRCHGLEGGLYEMGVEIVDVIR